MNPEAPTKRAGVPAAVARLLKEEGTYTLKEVSPPFPVKREQLERV